MEKKYIPLARFFHTSISDEVKLTYSEIENIMGQQLPNAAYLNISWWKKTKAPFSHFEAWVNEGYFVTSVLIGSEVTFSRAEKLDAMNNKTKDIFMTREIELIDARPFIKLKESIYSKSIYGLYQEDEFSVSVQSIRKQINESKKGQTGTILLGLFNGNIVGYIEIKRFIEPRNHHVASLTLGVLDTHQDKGVAKALISASQAWANTAEISRLEATVVEENKVDINAFISNEFVSEGLRKNAYKVNNQLLNEVYLSKFI